MKEFSVEEKAKRYDSMFERLKEMYNNNKTNVADRLIYERYFPELKESKDEKIRKSLLVQYKGFKSTDYYDDGIMFGDVVNWFEKQGDKDEEILILKDQIESLHAAIKAIKETHKIELEKQGEQKSVEPTDLRTWKPSDEQMKALTFACIKNAGIDKSTIKALYDLKEQLKQL